MSIEQHDRSSSDEQLPWLAMPERASHNKAGEQLMPVLSASIRQDDKLLCRTCTECRSAESVPNRCKPLLFRTSTHDAEAVHLHRLQRNRMHQAVSRGT